MDEQGAQRKALRPPAISSVFKCYPKYCRPKQSVPRLTNMATQAARIQAENLRLEQPIFTMFHEQKYRTRCWRKLYHLNTKWMNGRTHNKNNTGGVWQCDRYYNFKQPKKLDSLLWPLQHSCRSREQWCSKLPINKFLHLTHEKNFFQYTSEVLNVLSHLNTITFELMLKIPWLLLQNSF